MIFWCVVLFLRGGTEWLDLFAISSKTQEKYFDFKTISLPFAFYFGIFFFLQNSQ